MKSRLGVGRCGRCGRPAETADFGPRDGKRRYGTWFGSERTDMITTILPCCAAGRRGRPILARVTV